MEHHSSRVPSEKEEVALFNDLGSFEGFSFRDQQAIERDLSAEEVVNWDHDEDGEAEFWPAGDRPGVQLIFEGASSVSAREIVALDELLQELGDDEVETYARIYAAMSYHGRNITELTAEEVEDLSAHIFIGWNFLDVREEAAYELYELYYPEAYKVWEESLCDGLIFDVDRFLESPVWYTEEFTIGDINALPVIPQ